MYWFSATSIRPIALPIVMEKDGLASSGGLVDALVIHYSLRVAYDVIPSRLMRQIAGFQGVKPLLLYLHHQLISVSSANKWKYCF